MIGWILYYLQWVLGVGIMAWTWTGIVDDLKIKNLICMMVLSCVFGWVAILVTTIWLVGEGLDRLRQLIYKGLLIVHIPQWLNKTLIEGKNL